MSVGGVRLHMPFNVASKTFGSSRHLKKLSIREMIATEQQHNDIENENDSNNIDIEELYSHHNIKLRAMGLDLPLSLDNKQKETESKSGGSLFEFEFPFEETYDVEVDDDSVLTKKDMFGGYSNSEHNENNVNNNVNNEYNEDGTKKRRGTRLVRLSASALRNAATRVHIVSKKLDQMTYMQIMAAGAISRTMAQTIMHPANTFKTMLQLKSTGNEVQLTPQRLLRGADAQFIMSLPHGAFYFFVIDQVKSKVNQHMPSSLQYLSDFTASAISTIVCSVVSTPQMVITDRLMAGVYPSFPLALRNIFKNEGLLGFYAGWRSGLAQKIPSYGLTWMFFQQLKRAHESVLDRKPNAETNFVLGAFAAAGSVAVMIPMDTVKTRLVIQGATSGSGAVAYKGVRDCFIRVLREEGVGSFYRALPPRLMSVVPMIAIQFGVYEIIKSRLVQYNADNRVARIIRRKKAILKERPVTGHFF